MRQVDLDRTGLTKMEEVCTGLRTITKEFIEPPFRNVNKFQGIINREWMFLKSIQFGRGLKPQTQIGMVWKFQSRIG